MKVIYYPIAQHLQKFCKPDQFVIWRDSFRWKRHNPLNMLGTIPSESEEDEVLCNHYDSIELEQLAEDFGYEIEWAYNLKHVAIVRKV